MAQILANAKQVKTKTIDPNNDPEIIARIKFSMLKGEQLMAWYSRVGLGRSQIMQMSKDQITAFVEQANANQNETDATMYAPKPVPKKPSRKRIR